MTQGINFDQEVNTPTQQTPQIRAQGVNIPNPQVGQTLQQGQEIDVPDQSAEEFQEVLQAQQQTFDAIRQSNQAQAEAKIADLKAKGHSPSGQKLGALAQEVVNTVGIIQERRAEIQERQARLQQQKRQRLQKERENTARNMLREKMVEMQQTIRKEGLKQGVQKFRREGRKVLREYRDKLSPAQFEELQESFESTLAQAQEDLTKRQLEMQAQAKDTKTEIASNEIITKLQANIQGIKHSDNPEKVRNKINETLRQAIQMAGQRASEPQMLREIYLPVLKEVRDSASASAEARAQAGQKVTQIQDYAEAVKPLYEKYNNGQMSYGEFRTRLEQQAQAHNVTELQGQLFRTREEMRKDVEDSLQTRKKIKQLSDSKDSAVSKDMLRQFEDAEIGRIVHSVAVNEDMETRFEIEQALASDDPEEQAFARAMIEKIKLYEEDRKKFINLRDQALENVADITELKVDNREVLFNEFIPEVRYNETAKRLELPEKSDAVKQLAEQNSISEQQVRKRLNVLLKKRENTLKQMAFLKRKWRSTTGINIADPSDDSDLAKKQQAIEPLREEAQRQPTPTVENKPMRGENVPNPREGDTAKPGTPAVSSLAQSDDGVFVRPFSKEVEDQIQVTSGYGQRKDPLTGETSTHNGVDYSAPEGTKVKTVQGGKVLFSKRIKGFGNTVAVKTPDGHTEMYAHLEDFDVKKGQEIAPGTSVGEVGSTGRTTGDNLVHVQIWKQEPVWGGRSTQFANTVDPAQYLREVKPNHAEPRGQGTPPSQKMPGGDQRIPTQTNRNRPVKEQHHAGNPMRANAVAPAKKVAYPNRNDLTANYGYDALKNNPEFAKKVNQVANEIGIPGQWLADIMAHETAGTFRPDIKSGYKGDQGTGLLQFTQWTAKNMLGTTLERLEQMSRTEQMTMVAKYLRNFKGELNTIQDTVSAIYGGRPMLENKRRRRNHNGFQKYMKALGRHAGRRYRQDRDRAQYSRQQIHTSQVEGCNVCTQMLRKNGMITPHYPE